MKQPGHGGQWKPKPSLRDIKRMKEADMNINAARRDVLAAEEKHREMQAAFFDLMAEMLGDGSFIVSSVHCVTTHRRCVYVGWSGSRQCWFCNNHEHDLY